MATQSYGDVPIALKQNDILSVTLQYNVGSDKKAITFDYVLLSTFNTTLAVLSTALTKAILHEGLLNLQHSSTVYTRMKLTKTAVVGGSFGEGVQVSEKYMCLLDKECRGHINVGEVDSATALQFEIQPQNSFSSSFRYLYGVPEILKSANLESSLNGIFAGNLIEKIQAADTKDWDENSRPLVSIPNMDFFAKQPKNTSMSSVTLRTALTAVEQLFAGTMSLSCDQLKLKGVLSKKLGKTENIIFCTFRTIKAVKPERVVIDTKKKNAAKSATKKTGRKKADSKN